MTKKTLFLIWGGLYILCAILGFIPGTSGTVSAGVQGLLTALSVLFFLPPFRLAHTAKQTGDRDTLKLLRTLAAASLAVTLVVLVANFASALASAWLGELLHILLILVSVPMFCSGYWVVSLFLWACLLMVCLSALRKRQG